MEELLCSWKNYIKSLHKCPSLIFSPPKKQIDSYQNLPSPPLKSSHSSILHSVNLILMNWQTNSGFPGVLLYLKIIKSYQNGSKNQGIRGKTVSCFKEQDLNYLSINLLFGTIFQHLSSGLKSISFSISFQFY